LELISEKLCGTLLTWQRQLGFWSSEYVWILVCWCLLCIDSYIVFYWYVLMFQWHSVPGDSGDHFMHVDWTVLSYLSADEYNTGAIYLRVASENKCGFYIWVYWPTSFDAVQNIRRPWSLKYDVSLNLVDHLTMISLRKPANGDSGSYHLA
jgi:hypothetical protein